MGVISLTSLYVVVVLIAKNPNIINPVHGHTRQDNLRWSVRAQISHTVVRCVHRSIKGCVASLLDDMMIVGTWSCVREYDTPRGVHPTTGR